MPNGQNAGRGTLQLELRANGEKVFRNTLTESMGSILDMLEDSQHRSGLRPTRRLSIRSNF